VIGESEHADNGAPTPKTTPRLCAASAGGATAAKTRFYAACAAKYGQVPNSCREENLASVQMKLVIFTVLFCSFAE
jgi:hypothetical protein